MLRWHINFKTFAADSQMSVCQSGNFEQIEIEQYAMGVGQC